MEAILDFERPVVYLERKILPANPYHGNIVFRGGVPPVLHKQLAAAIAMKSKFVPPPERKRRQEPEPGRP